MNLLFQQSLIISEYVVNFLKLATGESTIKQICEKAGLCVNNSNIDKIHELYYTTLYSTGVIETEEIELKKKKKDYIKLGFTIIPEKIVVFICNYLTFLFQKRVVIISLIFCLFVIFGGGIYFWHTTPQLDEINNCKPIIVVLLLAFVFLLHELGHSSALCYFGEIPHKIGIGLYLFAPVLFADVTNSWKLNNKQRMIVDLGGLHFQFITSCFYLFIFLISTHNDYLVAALFSFTIGIFNLNPFVKMDGYWFLSDFLNIPDLRQRARQKTFFFIQCFSKKKISCKIQDIAFVLYYAVSFLFTIAFIVYMLFWNIELFKKIPANIKTIITAILQGEYHNIDIVFLESIILPLIVIFLILNVLVEIIYRKSKNVKKYFRVNSQKKHIIKSSRRKIK